MLKSIGRFLLAVFYGLIGLVALLLALLLISFILKGYVTSYFK